MGVKDNILKSAYHLFATKGYETTSMQDIVKAAKTTKGGLYHHFKSKEELLFESIKHNLVNQESEFNLIIKQKDTKKKLILMGEQLIKVHSSNKDFNNMFLEVLMQSRKNTIIAKDVKKIKECKLQFLQSIIQDDFPTNIRKEVAEKMFFVLDSIAMHLSLNESYDYSKYWKETVEECYAKR